MFLFDNLAVLRLFDGLISSYYEDEPTHSQVLIFCGIVV